MIRTTPFHERTSARNETGLWEHWSGYLAATRYQASEKAEYVAIRNAAGVFDTSPLFKYRVHGPDAEAFLATALARDIRTCRPGRAQYTLWCDDRGGVVEDGVVLRFADDDFLLTAAEPNLAWFADQVGRRRVVVEDVSEAYGVLAFQGPRSREVLASLDASVGGLRPFDLAPATIGGRRLQVTRTGYTGDLGYELWIDATDGLRVWDTLAEASAGRGIVPFGLTALYMARIEAGLLLLGVDFHSSRFAWTDEARSTPVELGYGWMFRDIATSDRAFLGRDAIRRELATGSTRYRLTGLVLDWAEYDRRYTEAGVIPPRDHVPVHGESYLYDDDLRQVGYVTSFMYSPVLQRHIALGRVPPPMAVPGTRVRLELPVHHHYEYFGAEVTRLPLYDPPRRTA
jgi:aminomethyltransferase